MAKVSQYAEELASFTRRLAQQESGQVVADALECLLAARCFNSGFGFVYQGALSLNAEIDRAHQALPESVASAARVLAERGLDAQKSMVLNLCEPGDHPAELALHEAGFAGGLILPVVHWKLSLGALVMLSRGDAPRESGHQLLTGLTETSELEAEPIDSSAVEFAESVAMLLALALHREHRLEEEREQRGEIEEAGRMASLGVLTASVAHELRGPVGALVLQMEEQRRILDAARGDPAHSHGQLLPELVELASDMEAAVSRIRGTIDQLSKLSRRDSEPEKLDLGEVVREALGLGRPHLRRRGISLVEDIRAGVPVMGRRDNLGQVVLNLVFNAADACEQSQRPNRRITVRVQEESGQALLEVRDTGPGIPEQSINTIFRPFFTTKARGKGTGLGLKICSDVATAHGGHIEVASHPEGGASFRVLLPLSREERRSLRTARRSDTTRARKIMVVDDDPIFARSIRRALKDYDVLIASAASEAEIALSSPGIKPDLVLCDVFLPGVNGNVLHARLKRRDPELASRFVFVTGGALGKEEADYLKSSGCPTLFKPLNIDEIVAMLEDEPDPGRTLLTLAGGGVGTARQRLSGE